MSGLQKAAQAIHDAALAILNLEIVQDLGLFETMIGLVCLFVLKLLLGLLGRIADHFDLEGLANKALEIASVAVVALIIAAVALAVILIVVAMILEALHVVE
jgi:hypothetical protein